MLMVFCKLHRWSSLSKELLPPFLLPSHPQECWGFEKESYTQTHIHRDTHMRKVSGQWTQQWHSCFINLLYFATKPFCTKTHCSALNNGVKTRCIAKEMISAGLGRCRGQRGFCGFVTLILWTLPEMSPSLCLLLVHSDMCTAISLEPHAALIALVPLQGPAQTLSFCLHLVISAHQEKWLTHCESFNASSLLQVSNCIDKSPHPLSPSPPPQLPL